MDGNLSSYSLHDLSSHNSKESVWVLINGIVYDVTKYLNDHPGGSEILMEHAGKNATKDFENIGHSEEARSKMKEFAIGKIETPDATRCSASSDSSESRKCHCEIM